jgi:phage shock protein A
MEGHMKKCTLCALAFFLVFSVLSAAGVPVGKPAADPMVTALSYQTKKMETQLAGIRNQGTSTTTSFQNFDQKANQLFNILSTVLKNAKDAGSNVIRNIR